MGNAASEFFSGTGLIDLVIFITFLEGVFLGLRNIRTGRGPRSWEVWLMLMPGMWLMLALRNVVTGQHWLITAVFLLAAGLGHVADLLWRQRGVSHRTGIQ